MILVTFDMSFIDRTKMMMMMMMMMIIIITTDLYHAFIMNNPPNKLILPLRGNHN